MANTSHSATPTTTITRSQPGIDAEAGRDGIYLLRTDVPADDLDTATVVTACQNQALLERDLRIVKAGTTVNSFTVVVGYIQAMKGRLR